ncbi:MAG: hypothetical protein HRK26_02525 [Rickettsiaceae bacterium H1]|nr:hypothetical protein [Rickettsiaceae bacterium H1]
MKALQQQLQAVKQQLAEEQTARNTCKADLGITKSDLIKQQGKSKKCETDLTARAV